MLGGELDLRLPSCATSVTAQTISHHVSLSGQHVLMKHLPIRSSNSPAILPSPTSADGASSALAVSAEGRSLRNPPSAVEDPSPVPVTPVCVETPNAAVIIDEAAANLQASSQQVASTRAANGPVELVRKSKAVGRISIAPAPVASDAIALQSPPSTSASNTARMTANVVSTSPHGTGSQEPPAKRRRTG